MSAKVPATPSVERKFLRMTLAERTRFIELFAAFSSVDWRRFRTWIRKLVPLAAVKRRQALPRTAARLRGLKK